MIVKFNKKNSIVIFVILLIVTILIFMIRINQNMNTISFDSIQVKLGNITIHITSTGLVQPKNRLEIKPPISGRIESVLIKEGDYVKKGSILAWMSSNERAALLDAARAKGVTEVEYWEKYYKATPILSPMDGTVILRNVEEGQTFTNQDAIFALSDELSVKANVDETDLGLVKKGQKATIVLDAYPGNSFIGRVDHIAYEAKTINNVTTYEVDITPLNSPPYIRSGMTSNVTFVIENKKDVPTIPNSAILYNQKETSVKVPAQGGKQPVIKNIKIGISDGKYTEVLEGLKLGDTVLVQDLGSLGAKTGFNPFRINRKKK